MSNHGDQSKKVVTTALKRNRISSTGYNVVTKVYFLFEKIKHASPTCSWREKEGHNFSSSSARKGKSNRSYHLQR